MGTRLSKWVEPPAPPTIPPQITDLARRVASAIPPSRQKRILVLDFVGPDGSLTELGRQLTSGFVTSMAQQSPGARILNREGIVNSLAARGYAAEVLLYSPWGEWSEVNPNEGAAIVGSIAQKANGLEISIDLYFPPRRDKVEHLVASMPLTGEDEEHIQQVIVRNPFPGIPLSGLDGYSDPKCLRCPSPQFPNQAARHRLSGTVVLGTVIGPDGRVEHVLVLRRLGGGLTSAAVQAVERWQLDPATGSDGKATTVQAAVMVEFHVY